MESALLELSLDYRRIARRVRCRMGSDPVSKQRALAALARQADRARRIAELPSVPDADAEVRAFAAAVSSAMEGPILRYSHRQQLIRQAEGLGIRRFDANLLIASVQNRLGSVPATDPLRPAHKRSVWGYAPPIALAILMQTFILLGAWGIWHQ